MKKTSAFLVALIASTSLVFAGPQGGKPAPDFTAVDSTGRTHSLADFKGRTVVLEWFNAGCPFVKKHYGVGSMQKLQKAATEEGVVWLAVISSAPGKQGHATPAQAEALRSELGMGATAVLLDEKGELGRTYAALTTPEMFVINAEGVLVYQGAIDDRPDADSASIEGATNHVANALAALRKGALPEPAQTKSYGCSVKY